jgi:hypothetical protein
MMKITFVQPPTLMAVCLGLTEIIGNLTPSLSLQVRDVCGWQIILMKNWLIVNHGIQRENH